MNKIKTNNLNGEFVTDAQLCEIYNLGKVTCRKIADESGSVFMIGRCRRIDRRKFDEYIRKTYLKK